MKDQIAVETDLFEHRRTKPHFINPHCFGEDFAQSIRKEVFLLAQNGFEFSEVIQEDYGWGFWATKGKDPFRVAFSYVGDGPQEEPAQWVVTVAYDPGLNIIKRLFHKSDRSAFALLRDRVWQFLKSNSGIKVIDISEYGKEE